MEGTAEVSHPIAAAHLPEVVSVFDAATTPNTVLDMAAPQPTLVELLVRYGLLPRERLPQIEINSVVPIPHPLSVVAQDAPQRDRGADDVLRQG
jgi:hypothetical protein